MACCQKNKCSSSWPPIITCTCIVNIQSFIHTVYEQYKQYKHVKGPNNNMQENISRYRFTVLQSNNNKQVLWQQAYPTIPPLKNIGFNDTSLEQPFISEYFDCRSSVPI